MMQAAKQQLPETSGEFMNPITVVSARTGRSAYSVVPDPDDPVILQLDGQLCRVIEISAAGFRCPRAALKAGRRASFRLDLPTAASDIQGLVDVLPATEEEFLQCQFVNLNADDLDRLHHYVLVRQKQAIRSLRRQAPPMH